MFFQKAAVCCFCQEVTTNLRSEAKDASPQLFGVILLSFDAFSDFFFLTCILMAVYKSQLLNTERRNECSSGSSSVSETPLDNQGGGRELLGRN